MTLEGHLDSKEIKPVNPKENQPQILIGKSDAKAETLILWPPDVKNQHIRKDPDAGQHWRQEEKGMTEDEMVGCIPDSVDMSFDQALGDNEEQGSLVCCSSWDLKESNMA